jgi:MFS family permease
MTSAENSSPGLRRNGNFQRLWLGQAVSITGDYVFNTTIILWITVKIAPHSSWAPAAVGGVVIAAAAPAMIVGPIAGVFVDRWNRRRTMLIADACRAVLIASLLLLADQAVARRLSPLVIVGLIYLVVAVASAFAQFFNPSRFAVLGLVVAPDDRAKASGLFQATGSFAAIIGPPLAAPLLFAFGVQWALLINAGSFALSFATILAMRLPPDEREPRPAGSGFGTELTAGLRFFRSSPTLITVAVGAIVATLGAGAIGGLAVFFVIHNLGANARWLGTLDGGEGAGAVIGALAAGWIAGRFGATRVFWLGLALAGLGVIWFSRTGTILLAVTALFATGLMLGAVNAAIFPLLLSATPQQMLGRVVAVIAPAQQLAGIVSIGLASLLATTVLAHLHVVVAGVTFNTYDAIFGAAGLIIVIAGLASIVPLRSSAGTTGEAAAEGAAAAGHGGSGEISAASPPG